MSYTTFTYGKPTATQENGNVTVSVTITNQGKVAGKEIAQIYATAPKTGLPRAARELKGFAKTRTLRPGESETLTITIPKDDLRYYDETTHGWALTKGTYTLHVGASVNDIRGHATITID